MGLFFKFEFSCDQIELIFQDKGGIKKEIKNSFIEFYLDETH